MFYSYKSHINVFIYSCLYMYLCLLCKRVFRVCICFFINVCMKVLLLSVSFMLKYVEVLMWVRKGLLRNLYLVINVIMSFKKTYRLTQTYTCVFCSKHIIYSPFEYNSIVYHAYGLINMFMTSSKFLTLRHHRCTSQMHFSSCSMIRLLQTQVQYWCCISCKCNSRELYPSTTKSYTSRTSCQPITMRAS